MTTFSRDTIVSWIALLALAGLVGASVARVSTVVAILLAVAVVALLSLVAARAAFAPNGHMEDTAPAAVEDPRWKLPRFVYYCGAATIGLLTVRPAASLTLSDWLFFLALGLTVLVILLGGLRRDYEIPRTITIGVAIFAVGGLISSFGAIDAGQSVSVVARLLYLTLVWFWLGTILLETRRHVEIAITAWVASAAVSSAGAVVQYFYGDVIPGGTIAWGRMTGFTPHTNNLAGLAATAFVPALMIAVDSSTRLRKAVGTGSVALIAAGILLSGSVGAILTAGASMVFWMALRGVSQRLVISLGAVVAAAFVLMSSSGTTLSPAPIERFERVTQSDPNEAEGSVFTRVEGYRDAWERIRDNPVIGVGLDEASNARLLRSDSDDEGHLVHNIVINPWFSAGILGVVGMLLILAGGFGTARWILLRSSDVERRLVSGVLASYVAFVIFAMGEPILFVRYGWFSVAILVAIRAQMIRATAQERTALERHAPRRAGFARPQPAEA